MKQFTSFSQQVGLLGENIAIDYLNSRGFVIIDRNYTKKIGEIDIVAKKSGVIHFIEVKTLIKYGTYYNPFENITPYKLRKIRKTVEWYLLEKRISRETLWVIDALSVEVWRENRSAKLSVMWNIL